MQIGGFDIGFDNIGNTHAGDVFGVIKSLWPHARFEDVDTSPSASKSDADRDSVEFFVYRNYAAFCAINKLGVEDFLKNDFVHVILESRIHNHATIVVGERNEEVEELIRRLEDKLGWKLHEYVYEKAVS